MAKKMPLIGVNGINNSAVFGITVNGNNRLSMAMIFSRWVSLALTIVINFNQNINAINTLFIGNASFYKLI